jgi:hypothetical protein
MPKSKGKQHCLAYRCGALVDAPHIFCLRHWSRLPEELRVPLWEAHNKAGHVGAMSYVEAAISYLRAQDIAAKRG